MENILLYILGFVLVGVVVTVLDSLTRVGGNGSVLWKIKKLKKELKNFY